MVIGNRVTRPLADAVAALNDIADGTGSDPAPQGAEQGRGGAAGRAPSTASSRRIQSVVSQVGRPATSCWGPWIGCIARASMRTGRCRAMAGDGSGGDRGDRDEPTAQEVAASASNAASATSDAARESGCGPRVVNSAIGSINRLVDEVHVAARVIEQLAHETAQDRLRGGGHSRHRRSDQPAGPQRRHRGGPGGEQGRGFAVVADEVRSSRAVPSRAPKRSTMLQRLQGGVKQAVEVMQASEARSQETVQEASHIASSPGQHGGGASAPSTTCRTSRSPRPPRSSTRSPEDQQNLVAIQQIVSELN